MGKRTAVAFFLSLLVLMGYNYFVAQKHPPTTSEVLLEQKEQPLPFSSPVIPPAQPEKIAPLSPVLLKGAKEVVVETDLVKVVITSSGARIKSCQLKDYPEEKISLASLQAQLARETLLRERNKLEVLLERMEQKPRMAEMISLAAMVDADFSPAIIIPDNQDASVALNTDLYRCSQDVLTLSEGRPEGRIVFTYADAQGRQITKIYSFSNSSYAIELDVAFQGWEQSDFPAGNFLVSCGPDVGLPQAQQGRRAQGYQGPLTYFQNAQRGWVRKEKYTRQESNTFIRREHREGGLIWTGLENKYFLSALVPSPSTSAESVVVERNKFGEQKVAVSLPWKGSGPYSFRLYLGPRKEDRLKELGVSLEKAIDYGFFDPIARLIYRILVFFSGWAHNFGWAIVLLCLVVKIVFYPLTHRSFESMQKMQHEMKSVQPEMTALREKHKANPQKLNKEIMELYRRKGINPLASCQSGCLPLLLQMPVFFALYAVLYNSIELRGTPFLGWITDLSAKDPYYVLPVLMGISMFAQQKLTGIGGAGGAQQDQAKMMAWMMPLLLTWIFASLPSGVVLYWLTFNILTALQQVLIRKKQEAKT